MRTVAFSIISPNYRHFARVLMSSVERHHPDWDRFVLLVGDEEAANDEPFTIVPLDALSLPNARQFCFRYTLLELNTAVKPWMFEHVFARGYDRVVYFDPDIFLYSPLEEIEPARGEFLTLTPHLTGRIGSTEHPSEQTILQSGAYNLGFLVVSRQPQLAEFLKWWQEKLEFRCIVDVERGLFVDQKWIDLAPGLFDGVSILRHDGYNVAYWNLEQRRVAGATVNGQPLRFFHFSGFDPANPAKLSRFDHATHSSNSGDVRKLVDDYAGALHAAGYETSRRAPYAFGFFSDGTPIPEGARIAYRNSTALQSAAGNDPFAHPALFRSKGFRSRQTRAAHFAVRTYQSLSRARPLVRLFPRSVRASLRQFLLGRRDPRPKRSNGSGLNIVGYFSRNSGIAESARLCQKSCDAAGVPNQIIDIDSASGIEQRAVHGATIYHVNADQILDVREHLPNVFNESEINIGCWHWELPELPDAWIASAEPLDEIWAPSAFIQSAISRKVTIPVVHMPHGVEVTNIEPCSLAELGVPPNRFTFLCMFDFDSVMERKNPFGAIDAFTQAFPRGGGAASLLIKTGNAAAYPKEHADLQSRLRGAANVHFIDQTMSRARANGLIAACDSVVSLHRSEGFGLILAEAMYLAKPVVATGWSGNMDFMNSGNSCPVAYELVTLDRAHSSYEAGQTWAEPDVDHAAHLMRDLVDDDQLRTVIGGRARATIRKHFSHEVAGLRYRRRLEFLGSSIHASP